MLATSKTVKGSRIVFIFTLCLATQLVAGLEEVLTGYHFMDNQLEKRFGPDNGYATYNIGKPNPDQVAVKFYMHIGFLGGGTPPQQPDLVVVLSSRWLWWLQWSSDVKSCVEVEWNGIPNIRYCNQDYKQILVVLSEISVEQT